MRTFLDWILILFLVVITIPLAVVMLPFVVAFQIADAWSMSIALLLNSIFNGAKKEEDK